MPRTLRLAAPGLLLAAVLLLPFLDKAFTIDDTLFLAQAKHLLVDPRHPTAFDIVWSEFPEPRRLSSIMPSGPVMAYLLLPTVVLGGAEWVGHLTQLLLFCLAILATVSLGRRLRLGDQVARLSGLVLAATPAAAAMAATVMPDVPAMAFGVVGLERLAAYRDRPRWTTGAVASLALALGALSRSHVILLLLVGALLIVDGRPSLLQLWSARSLLWPLVAAPIWAALLMGLTRDPEAGVGALAGAAMLFGGLAGLGPNLVAFGAHWMLALPLALPVVLLRWRELSRSRIVWAAVPTVMLLLRWANASQWSWWLAPVAGLGLAAVAGVSLSGWRRRNATGMILGAWLLVPLAVVPYRHLPSKYLMASAPACALVVARLVVARWDAWSRWALGLTLAAGATLSILIMTADAEFAGSARAAADALIRPRVAAGENVWYDGHWGFQWYAERAGAHGLSADDPDPDPGDIVVSSPGNQANVLALFPDRVLVESVEYSDPGPRLMCVECGSGFYSNGWGYLPWSWGSGDLVSYEVWRFE